MASNLSKEIKDAIHRCEYQDPDTYQKFLDRIEQGKMLI